MTTQHTIKFERFEGEYRQDEWEAPVLVDGQDVGSIKQVCEWDTTGALTSSGDRKVVVGYTVELGDEEHGDVCYPTLKAARDRCRAMLKGAGKDVIHLDEIRHVLRLRAARREDAK